MQANFTYAIILTTLAGLSTAIGGGIGQWASPKIGSSLLFWAFSAGVDLHIFFGAAASGSERKCPLLGYAAFFMALFIAVLDITIPHEYKEEH